MNTNHQQSHRFQAVINLMGTLTAEQSQLALGIYRGISNKGLVTLSELAKQSGKSESEIDAYLKEIPGVFRDDDGNVIGFWGLTAAPVSDHKLTLNGKTLYAWCAWDTLFLPALLNTTASVQSKCAQTGQAISLEVSPETIVSSSSPDIQVSMLVPEESQFNEDIVGSFCHYIYFFANIEAGVEWIEDRKGIELMTLTEAFELGQAKNRNQFAQTLN